MDFSKELDGTISKDTSTSSSNATPGQLSPFPGLFGAETRTDGKMDSAKHATTVEDAASVDSSDGECTLNTLSERIAKMNFHPSHPKFVGKSSGVLLVYEAFLTKHETDHQPFLLQQVRQTMARRPQFWTIAPVRIVHCAIHPICFQL